MDNLWYNFDLFMSLYLEDGALVRWCTSRPMFILISLLGRPPLVRLSAQHLQTVLVRLLSSPMSETHNLVPPAVR